MAEKIYTIYLLVFPDKRVYIGKTHQKLKYRWDNGNGYHGEVKEAIDKYGWDNIEKIILRENLSEDEANMFEKEEITKHGGINHPLVLNTQSGGDSGWTCSDKQKEKLSKITKQYYVDHPEKRNQISIMLNERPEIREKINASLKQRYIDHPEYKEELSERGKRFREEHPGAFDFQKIKIDQYSYDGNFMCTYESIMDAADKTGIHMSAISNCVNGKAITAGGYRWIEHGKHFGILDYSQCGGLHEKISVAQINRDTGEIIAVYNSIGEASRSTSVNISGISQCINGKLNHAGGYIWKRL